MKQLSRLFLSLLLVAVGLTGSAVHAVAPGGDIAIIEIKPTSSESVVIENISSTSINLQNYAIEYFNKSVPVNFNIPTNSQQLPNFTLLPQQSFLFTGDYVGTCGASGVANLGVSLSDTSGYLQIVKISNVSGVVSHTPQDKVNWTSTSSGADIVSVPSATSDANAVWYRKLSDGSWNKYEIDAAPCNLFITVIASAGPTYIDWANGTQAPSEVVVADSNSSASVPASDFGLAPPQITELFPNPASPQSDDEDEFIELYNPNSSDFDLSGFKLQVGLATVHNYTFPAGTLIPAKSFKAFFSIDTNLAMSNTNGQARLIDPAGTVISQSEQYVSAKEGQSWSLSGGQWYWANPTPEKANKVVLAATINSGSTKSPIAAVKGSSTGAQSGNNAGQLGSSASQTTKVHFWTIAAIGFAALLYAAYEYRNDLANNLYRLRRYRETRRAAGWLIKNAIGYRTESRLGRRQNHAGKRSGPRAKKPRPGK